MSSRVMSWPGSSELPQRKPGDSAISASRSASSASQITSSSVPLKLPRRYSSVSVLPTTSPSIFSCGARTAAIFAAISASGAITSEKIGMSLKR